MYRQCLDNISIIFVLYFETFLVCKDNFSFWCISRQECSVHVNKKLCINFEVSSFVRSTLGVFRVSKRTCLCLTIVNGVFHVRNAVCSVSILKYLDSLEVPCLQCVPRASPKESKRTCLVPDCSQWCISHKKCSMHVTRKLCFVFLLLMLLLLLLLLLMPETYI